MRTIRKQVREAGFRIVEIRGSSIPIRLIIGRWLPEFVLQPMEWILARVTRLWIRLFAYQIIVVLRRA